MPRKYTKIKVLEPEVLRMKAGGKTNREIAEHFGLTHEQIRVMCEFFRRIAQRKLPLCQANE